MRSLAYPVLMLAASLAAPIGAQGSPVTRRDLADAYLQVDQVAMARGIPAAQRARWNQDFDRTTLAFFGGDFARVLRDMHDLLARMVGDSATHSPTRSLLAVRLRPTSRVLVSGRDGALTMSATVMYVGDGIAPRRAFRVRLLDAAGTAYAEDSLVVPPGVLAGATATATLDVSSIIHAPGRYVVEATLPGAALPLRSDVFVMAAPADSVRAELQRAIAALPAGADGQSLASVKARVELIVERPSESNSAQFIADPAALAADVAREVRALAAGRDPFAHRAGDVWRVLVGPSGEVPMRLYAPRHVNTATPLPVVLAFHGAGADENMFLEGYGDGRLRALADSVGFILLSPNSTAFARDLGALDSALAMLEREYVIDRAQVYAIGHSMGGAVVSRLATERRAQLRAAVVMAGVGTPPPQGRMTPTLFLGAEVDLVIPVTRVRAAYEAILATGALVEFRQADGWGHTLVVGALLDDAVRWLRSR